ARFLSTTLHEPPSTSIASSLLMMQLQKRSPPVVVLMSTPSSWSGGVFRGSSTPRPSRMLRNLIVTFDELRVLITSPLLPVRRLPAGSCRATVDVSGLVVFRVRASPGHPPAGGTPVMITLNTPSIRTGRPTHFP